MPAESSQTPLPAPTTIEQAALGWFARCDRGLSPAEEEQFTDWLAADSRHAEIFNELSGTWNLLGGMRAPAATIQPATVATSRSTHWHRWVLPLAAAAAVALAYFGYWRPRYYTTDTATEIGIVRTLHLPDGTIARLSTDTELTVGFKPGERRIALLRGEASFAVAKDPTRPFTVMANGVAVRAVGTAFNVRLAEQSVEVLVLEGKVRVSDAVSGASLLTARPHALDAEGLPVLVPGERAVVAVAEPRQPAPAPAVVTELAPGEMERRTAWQERRLEFESTPLSEMVAEFNRFNRSKLVVADPALAARCFGGSFRADDADGFVRMLQENFGVTVERMDGVTILRAPR